MLRRQPATRANAANVLLCKRLTSANVCHRVKRSASEKPLLFTRRTLINDAPDSGTGISHGLDHVRELLFVHGKSRIDGFLIARNAKVFFNYACTQSGGCNVHRIAHRMIRKAYWKTKAFSHVSHCSNVHVFIDGRIFACALKQNNLLVSFSATCVDGILNFFHGAHSATDYHGLALRGGVFD